MNCTFLALSKCTVCFLSQVGGKVEEVKVGVPDILRPEETDRDSISKGGGLSGGAVAAIVVVIIIAVVLLVPLLAGILVKMRRRQSKFDILSAVDYHSNGATQQSDTYIQTAHGSFQMKPSSNTYTSVPVMTTTIPNSEGLSSEEKH